MPDWFDGMMVSRPGIENTKGGQYAYALGGRLVDGASLLRWRKPHLAQSGNFLCLILGTVEFKPPLGTKEAADCGGPL